MTGLSISGEESLLIRAWSDRVISIRERKAYWQGLGVTGLSIRGWSGEEGLLMGGWSVVWQAGVVRKAGPVNMCVSILYVALLFIHAGGVGIVCPLASAVILF